MSWYYKGADSVTVSGKSGGYAVQRLLYYRNKTSVSLPTVMITQKMAERNGKISIR